jgi:hypothetical protein
MTHNPQTTPLTLTIIKPQNNTITTNNALTTYNAPTIHNAPTTHNTPTTVNAPTTDNAHTRHHTHRVTTNNSVFPEFNHNPIRPTIIAAPPPAYVIGNKHSLIPLSPNATEQDTRIPPPAYVVGMGTQIRPQTPEEKLERQRQSNRERQKRFLEKTKPFSGLAHLPTINERIRQLWLLTYPETYSSIQPDVLDRMISQFVETTFGLMGSNRQLLNIR